MRRTDIPVDNDFMTNDQLNNDIQEFINYSRDFADQCLVEHGEFFPFASQIDKDGKFSGVGFEGDDDRPLSQTLIDTMTDHFENEINENNIRSYCITFDVRIKNDTFPDGIDSIIVSVRHDGNNNPLKYFFPYSISNSGIKYYDGWLEKN